MGESARAVEARRIWDRVAPSYDRRMAFLERHMFGDGRVWLAARARGRVLDVGVGTGGNLAHYPDDVTVTGLDLSPAMLALVRRRAVDLGRTVDLHEGDAERLPFADGSFDTVVCALALCTVPDPAAAIAEARRVLVPGGRLLLLDHVVSTWPPIHAFQWVFERFTIPAAGEHFTRRQVPLVRAAGFTIAATRRTRAGTVECVDAVRPADPGTG
ncbi:methyltransferase domain-containing protein [Actinoplanes hulinensis]|uniref:Methyltransferase domain-containing protein n=1 Tax=Actinoplanes hulinensis TaxID=1144547 RepID=A0ABS7BGQ9_9ACTN|nr:methyltransferase domain-containing protein [Actinoplanes hulinensis]MBW6440061.1 methyltransferase domain-containing protein [Actinoplanes hulinensis]